MTKAPKHRRLTDDEVREVLAQLQHTTPAALARRSGLALTTVYYISRGLTYQRITRPGQHKSKACSGCDRCDRARRAEANIRKINNVTTSVQCTNCAATVRTSVHAGLAKHGDTTCKTCREGRS